MKDYLKDLILYVKSLESIDLLRIDGTDKETQVSAMADNRSVIVMGTFNQPILDFVGTFGMPNLMKLKTILSFEEYDDTAVINMLRGNQNDPDVPTAIRFQTQNNDFVNEYRLMAKAVVEEKVLKPKFRGTTWNLQFSPTVASIIRLKKQIQANSEEDNFTTSIVKNDLKINFGDQTTHNGNFVFHSGVQGTLNRAWNWPVKEFQSIMDLRSDMEANGHK